MRYNTELSVHLGALQDNINLLRNHFLQDNEIIFMVKANAYGHGIIEIVKYAFESCGVTNFGVANLGEAVQIRRALPHLKCVLWVFSDSEIQNEKVNHFYADLDIHPVIHSLKDLNYFLESPIFNNVPLVLKFNTGMNRLGIDWEQVEDVIERLKQFGRTSIEHLMTHFSSAYLKLKTNDRTFQQYEKFKQIKKAFKANGIDFQGTSVSNSGALEQKFGLDESHVRPGLMLYGPRSVYTQNYWSGKIISSFKTQIIKVREVTKGTPVGYGGHICHDDGYLAYLPVGYGDGVLTFYSGAKFRVGDHTGQFIGRVNMDIAQLYFKQIPPSLCEGSEFFIWNDAQSTMENLVTQMKTIPYQLFTSVTSRVPRRYYL